MASDRDGNGVGVVLMHVLLWWCIERSLLFYTRRRSRRAQNPGVIHRRMDSSSAGHEDGMGERSSGLGQRIRRTDTPNLRSSMRSYRTRCPWLLPSKVYGTSTVTLPGAQVVLICWHCAICAFKATTSGLMSHASMSAVISLRAAARRSFLNALNCR